MSTEKKTPRGGNRERGDICSTPNDAKLSEKSQATHLQKNGLALHARGYPVIPIARNSKACKQKGWQKLTPNPEIIKNWSNNPDNAGCGILARNTPGVDIDCYDAGLVDHMVSYARQLLGETPRRDGMLPKTLLPCRCENPFKKIQSDTFQSPDGKKHKLEILGDGQQFVASAIHPDTKEPYTWIDSDGNRSDTLNLPRAALPEITEDQARALVKEFEAQGEKRGWIRTSQQAKPTLQKSTANSFFPLKCPGSEQSTVRDALLSMPSDDYTLWVSMLMACRADGTEWGRNLAEEWSQKSDKYDPTYFENKWVGLKPERTDYRSILAEAQRRGWGNPALKKKVDQPLKKEQFTFTQVSEFTAGPSPRWLVKYVVPETGLMMVYGESGSGKTFWLLDLIMAIALGIPWRGIKTKKARVIYIVAEGVEGFKKRPRAYAEYHGIDLKNADLILTSDVPNFYQRNSLPDLIEAIKALGGGDVIVIDTLAQTIPGADENAAQDMGAVMERLGQLQKETNSLVVLVHHSGKDPTRGARGSSALKAPLDAQFEIIKKDDARAAIDRKQKDEQDGNNYPFKLLKVELGRDEDGDPITSCIVEHLGTPIQRAPMLKGKWQKFVFEVIQNLSELTKGPLPVATVLAEAVKNEIHDPGPDPKKPKRDRRGDMAKKALTELSGRGVVVIDGDNVTLPQTPQNATNGICGNALKAESIPQIPLPSIEGWDCGIGRGEKIDDLI